MQMLDNNQLAHESFISLGNKLFSFVKGVTTSIVPIEINRYSEHEDLCHTLEF